MSQFPVSQCPCIAASRVSRFLRGRRFPVKKEDQSKKNSAKKKEEDQFGSMDKWMDVGIRCVGFCKLIFVVRFVSFW
ncbi:MAG: hypothetical protein GY696_36930 [Gammaproteobacteria bacterium]|nr:hypothetical protein [Gammaproteobacteria bacterium]